MSFFSLKIRPFFRTLGVIATCFWLSLIVAYIADKLTAPTPRAAIHQPAVVLTATHEAKEPTTPLTEKEKAERVEWALYGYSQVGRYRLQQLMQKGDGSLLCDFRTDFLEDFKARFGSRVCKDEKPEPDSDLVVSEVLASLKQRMVKDGIKLSISEFDPQADLSKLPPAYALYLKSLNTDRDQAIVLMDELLSLPPQERLAMNAIAKYRRARLRMSREDWSDVSDADLKASLKSIREDLASVAQHAREGSLDPASISENAAYWIAYSRSMIVPSERLIRLDEADFAGALRTYLSMPRRGRANAVNSCLWLAEKLCVEGQFESLVSDPDLRLLITLYLSAGGSDQYEVQHRKDLTKEHRLKWLDALSKAKIDPVFAAEHIALIQYACGRWQDCQTTSELMPKEQPLRNLLLSRCELRLHGDMSAARRRLDPQRTYPADAASKSPAPGQVTAEFDLTTLISLQEKNELVARVQGELGMHALAVGDFDEALTRFEDGGYSIEALYVAECLLSVDELKSHVDRRRATKQKAIKLGYRWSEPFEDLEQELGSRLMRAGRLEEALEYVDPTIRSKATEYVILRRGAERTELGDRSRADSHWRCALAIRQIGEVILHAPYGLSWASSGGWHVGYGYLPRLRLGQPEDELPLPTMKLVGSTKEEVRRLTEWQVRHIETPDLSERDARYASFRHAIEAVRLLPTNDPAGGEILQYAGNLLKYRDPKGATPAYRLLVTRFGETTFGAHALKSHWFSPERPSPPSDIISK